MNERASLQRLAEVHGVATAYQDARGVVRVVNPEVVAAVLEALGVRAADPELALLDYRRTRWLEPVEPAAVAWDGRGALLVRTPAAALGGRIEIDLTDEVGASRSLALRPGDTRIVAHASIDGVERVLRRVPLPLLATGYHSARVRVHTHNATTEGDVLVLSAPRRAHRPPVERRAFGLFAPVYALHSARSLGIGNLGDLQRLLRWTVTQGGATVATLPLLATFHDDPESVSPYAPISRLAWDELFLDLPAIPEFAASGPARTALSEARAAIQELRNQPRVNYQAAESTLWPVLSRLAAHVEVTGGARREQIEAFARERPLVDSYARFRAARERLGPSWRRWSRVQRGGVLQSADLAADPYRTHLFAQFALHEQLAALATEARADGGPGLYLDLPLGTHRLGFDAWRFPEAFADGLDAGAPPDVISTTGQNWHFAPGHPEGLRRSGYRYFIESVRNHLRYAGVLRIDHVMAMHRLYVIPRDGAASDGTYLSYRPEELWAILSIESHRAHAVVVGEDLGTVPAAVRSAMRRHAVGGSYVVQYEAGRSRPALRAPSALAVASLNTHDMPTFEGWVRGRDIEARSALGMLAGEMKPESHAERADLIQALRSFFHVSATNPENGALLRACLTYLGHSQASLVLVALSDLLGELDPENLPGTTVEHPNWQRRLSMSLDESADSTRSLELVALLREARASSRELSHTSNGDPA